MAGGHGIVPCNCNIDIRNQSSLENYPFLCLFNFCSTTLSFTFLFLCSFSFLAPFVLYIIVSLFLFFSYSIINRKLIYKALYLRDMCVGLKWKPKKVSAESLRKCLTEATTNFGQCMHVEAYLEDLDLWGEVEEDYEIPILLSNLTLTSI